MHRPNLLWAVSSFSAVITHLRLDVDTTLSWDACAEWHDDDGGMVHPSIRNSNVRWAMHCSRYRCPPNTFGGGVRGGDCNDRYWQAASRTQGSRVGKSAS